MAVAAGGLAHEEDGRLGLDFVGFVRLVAKSPLFLERSLEVAICDYATTVVDRMGQERLDPEEVARNGLGKRDLMRFIRKELVEEESCEQLPITTVFFGLFVSSLILHERPDLLHAVEKSIEADFMESANFAFSGSQPFDTGRKGFKSLADVNTATDFWSWMDMGALPLFLRRDRELSEVRSVLRHHCEAPRSVGDNGDGPVGPSISIFTSPAYIVLLLL